MLKILYLALVPVPAKTAKTYNHCGLTFVTKDSFGYLLKENSFLELNLHLHPLKFFANLTNEENDVVHCISGYSIYSMYKRVLQSRTGVGYNFTIIMGV